MVFGVVGVYFNRWILATTSWFKNYHKTNITKLVITGAGLGALFSFLHVSFPIFSGGSFPAIADIFITPAPWLVMAAIFALRMFGTIVCFGSGAPGGTLRPYFNLGDISRFNLRCFNRRYRFTHSN